MRIRVLTFNIRGSFVRNDGENAWETRAPLNVETVLRLDPDLIGFQELQTGNLATYERELPAYDFALGPKYNNRPPYCYPAIFWKSEKLEPLGTSGCWLSKTPERHSGDWETACFRSAAWTTFRCRQSGRSFLHLNTHLDHVCEQARVEQTRVALRKLEELTAGGLPALVTGDFNCDPGSVSYRLFLEAGFTDVFLAAGGQDREGVYSFHAFKGARNPKYGRIDWILARGGWKALACQIDTSARPPIYPSDHFPVLAELELMG